MEEDFKEWFTELCGFTFRCEWFEDDLRISDFNTRRKIMQDWVKCAYMEGYKKGIKNEIL